MPLRKFFHKGWRSFRKALHSDSRQKLVEILCQEYVEKAQNAVKFTEYAANMTYQQFRNQARFFSLLRTLPCSTLQ